MKVKTQDLISPALDWAVAKCEGHRTKLEGWPPYVTYVPAGKRSDYKYVPSTNWKQGGPIIDREGIGLLPADGHRGGQCEAFKYRRTHHDLCIEDGITHRMFGPTPLIASMRCYCCAKLGEFVNIPEELCRQQKT